MKEISLIECQAVSAGCNACGGTKEERIEYLTNCFYVGLALGIVLIAIA